MSTASVAEKTFSLNAEELDCWHTKGYAGPFTAWTPEQAKEMAPKVIAHMQRPSNAYGFNCIRDRHLDSATVFKACSHPAIVQRCASVLGPNLLLWRTNFFHKPPGAPAIAWHRGNNFPGVRGIPAIEPQVNITCWLALSDANGDNGAVQLIPGSHVKEYTLREGKGDGGIFGRGKVIEGLEVEDAVQMDVKAGQFFMFNELTIHGSDPNTSQTNRTGIAVRITSNETRVYPNQKVDGQGMHLKNWHAIMVQGEDTLKHNKIGPPPTYDDYSFGPIKKMRGEMRKRWQGYKYGLTFKRD